MLSRKKEGKFVADTKYGNLVRTLNYQKGRGGANAKELVFVSGEELGGFDLNFIVGVYDQTGDWAPGAGAHMHSFDECLIFFGYDDNDLGYLYRLGLSRLSPCRPGEILEIGLHLKHFLGNLLSAPQS